MYKRDETHAPASNSCTRGLKRIRECTGEGEGFCDGQRFPVTAGDLVVFPPRSTHGIDVASSGRLYALVHPTRDTVHA